jgi:hypothetical protein
METPEELARLTEAELAELERLLQHDGSHRILLPVLLARAPRLIAAARLANEQTAEACENLQLATDLSESLSEAQATIECLGKRAQMIMSGESLRLLVTGSRDWTDRRLLESALDGIVQWLFTDVVPIVVHGACETGADAMADEWARSRGYWREPHPVVREHGPWPAAGPRRNREMVEAGARVCAAFRLHGEPNKGTTDCFKQAIRACIATLVVTMLIRLSPNG